MNKKLINSYIVCLEKSYQIQLKTKFCLQDFRVKLHALWIPNSPQTQDEWGAGNSTQSRNKKPQPLTETTPRPTEDRHVWAVWERVPSALFLNAYHMGGTTPGPWWDHLSNWGGEQNPTIQKQEDFFPWKYEWFLNLYRNKKINV